MIEYQILELQEYKLFNVAQLVTALRNKGYRTYTKGNYKLFSEANLEQIQTTIDELN